MGSHGFGVGQVLVDGRCCSEENRTEHDQPAGVALSFVVAPEKTSRKRSVARKRSAGVDVVQCDLRLDTCGNGVSGKRFSRHSKFLASRCTPVDSGLQR